MVTLSTSEIRFRTLGCPRCSIYLLLTLFSVVSCSVHGTFRIPPGSYCVAKLHYGTNESNVFTSNRDIEYPWGSSMVYVSMAWFPNTDDLNFGSVGVQWN